MAVVVQTYRNPDKWLDGLRSHLAAGGREMPVHHWPTDADPESIEYAVVWKVPPAELCNFPNLRAILALGAGVDQFREPGYPDVPIVRMADDSMSSEMAAYSLHWVLHFQRSFDVTIAQQTKRIWDEPSYTTTDEFPIGILGYGTIGSRVGRAFADLGYSVNAWSRSGGNDPGVTHYAGHEELAAFLGNSQAVVNVLPSTYDTQQLVNADFLACCRPDTVFVNIGRGATVDEVALVDALDNGPLKVAVLDVVDTEPLPPESTLWTHPSVVITPHMSGNTLVRSATETIAANILRIESGEAPFPIYDPERGY